MSNSEMREYAKRLVNAVKDADLCDFIYGSDFCKSCQFIPMCKAARDCEAVLSAPLMNCEVGTAEEQTKRYQSFCKRHFCDECPLNNVNDDFDDSCIIRFGQMPYTEERKGEGK